MTKFNNIITKSNLSLIFLTIFLITFSLFYDLEPGIDQIRHISWAQSLSDSDHLIDFNLFKSSSTFFIKDENGFLFNLLKTGYTDIGHLFNLFPILLLYILNLTFFSPIIIFNFISIFFFTLNTFIAFLLFNKIYKDSLFKFSNKVINLLLLLSLIPSYLFYYSSLGVHNISLFFYLLSVFIIYDFNESTYRYKFPLLILISTLGIYSHKINLIFIPCLITYYFLSHRDYMTVFKYILLKFIIILPIIVIFFLAPDSITSTKKFADFDFSFGTLLGNHLNWLINLNKTLGPILIFFLIFGIWDLKKNFKKNRLILMIILIHLICYIFITTFSVYYVRTNLYITHIVIILSFAGFLKLHKNNSVKIKYILMFSYFAHLLWNTLPIVDFKERIFLNKDLNSYFLNNKKIKTSINEISEMIGAKNKIIYFDDRVKDYFLIYQKDLYKNNSLNINTIRNLSSNKIAVGEYDLSKLKDNNLLLISLEYNHDIIEQAMFRTKKKYEQKLNNCTIFLENIYVKKSVEFRNQSIFLDKIKCY